MDSGRFAAAFQCAALLPFLAVIDPGYALSLIHIYIIEQLKKTKTPVILVINKVDTVSRDKILEFIDTYRKVYDFAEIVPASALRAQNLDTCLLYTSCT